MKEAAVVAFLVIAATVVGIMGLSTLVANLSLSSNQPCGLTPGVSVVTINGVSKCVVGPPVIVNNDGRIDFRNGTVVNLHANLTASSFMGGSSADTVVASNATRFIFNARGVVAIIYPYQGKEVYANGTIRTFVPCAYPISMDPPLPRGASGNGTVWFTASNGQIVRFYPDGTCSASSG